MSNELERKFLVVEGAWTPDANPLPIEQGYLHASEVSTVRVRLAGNEAYLTIKGRTVGHQRDEYEYSIPQADARHLLGLCAGHSVRKQRHRVHHAGFLWEVDVFEGENAGLVVAEIEAPTDEALQAAVSQRPDWVGREVTANANLYNALLSQRPYSRWSKAEREALEGR